MMPASRFFREAETAGRLNHPNIVTIYDVGEEGGLAYIAMEYLKGRHLSDYAPPNQLLEPRKVLELIGRTADALGFAHKQQVVHRDIKPANLMYDPSTDVLKITDFRYRAHHWGRQHANRHRAGNAVVHVARTARRSNCDRSLGLVFPGC
jgi:tRNA A-37 threonylcarbamoyl transferase component Bud32